MIKIKIIVKKGTKEPYWFDMLNGIFRKGINKFSFPSVSMTQLAYEYLFQSTKGDADFANRQMKETGNRFKKDFEIIEIKGWIGGLDSVSIYPFFPHPVQLVTDKLETTLIV